MNSLLLFLILVVLVAIVFTLRQILLEMRMQTDFSKEDAVVKAARKEVEGAKGRIPPMKEVK